jgi:hypothetical protein
VIEVGGWRFENYNKNPVALFEHANTLNPPAGLCLARESKRHKYQRRKFPLMFDANYGFFSAQFQHKEIDRRDRYLPDDLRKLLGGVMQ